LYQANDVGQLVDQHVEEVIHRHDANEHIRPTVIDCSSIDALSQ
jgi:hypothetical protein